MMTGNREPAQIGPDSSNLGPSAARLLNWEIDAMLKRSLLTAAALFAFPIAANAQYSSSSGLQGSSGTASYGAFGSRTLGSGVSSGSSGSFSSPAGSGAGGSPGSGGNSTTSGMQGAGQVTGNERFIKANRNGAFVGADSGDATQVYSQQQNAQMQSLQQFSQQMQRANQQRNQMMNQNQNQGVGKKPIRVSISAQIPLPATRTSSAVSQQFATRLKRIPGMERSGAVQVSMEGRTAVLAGRVATARDRELAAGLALLEPGISSVRNELVVDSSASKAEVLPPTKPSAEAQFVPSR